MTPAPGTRPSSGRRSSRRFLRGSPTPAPGASRWRRSAVVLTLASSLLLTGCGEGDVYSGAAAIVNGKRIPVTELQESVDDLAVYSG